VTRLWSEEIVFTKADDGQPLEGVVVSPEDGAGEFAIVLVHGGTSRFCSPQYVKVARELASRGYVVVLGNNRGHDGFAVDFRGNVVWAHGASFEAYEEAPLDIAAWIAVAARNADREHRPDHFQDGARAWTQDRHRGTTT